MWYNYIIIRCLRHENTMNCPGYTSPFHRTISLSTLWYWGDSNWKVEKCWKMLKKQIHDMQLKSELSEVTLRINNNNVLFISDRGFPASVWITGQKQVTQKVYIQFPADSWPSCSHVTATEACCKVVSQYGSLIMLLLQTSPEPIWLILASKDFVAIQQGKLGRSESRGREKCGSRVLLAVDM